MSEFVSRVYVSTETIVICLPVTLLFVTARIPTQIFQLLLGTGRETAADMAAAMFVLAMLVCVWRLATAFVLGGRVGLRDVSAYWWVPPLAGAVLGLGISVHWWLTLASAPTCAGELAWALPFLLPLAHLCVERRLRPETAPRSAAPRRIRDSEETRDVRAELSGGNGDLDATLYCADVAPASCGARRDCGRWTPPPRDSGVPFA